VTLRVREGQPLTLSAEQLGRMTWPELVRLWKDYINAIAMSLVSAGRPGPDGAPGSARLQVRARTPPGGLTSPLPSCMHPYLQMLPQEAAGPPGGLLG
jgi:hypothetical protein